MTKTVVDHKITAFLQQIAERLFSEKDISHILNWQAGTLEYLIHILSYSVASQRYIAFNTEIPYITGMPYPGTKSNIKWADGACLLANGLGIFLEVKTIVFKAGELGKTIKKVPLDMAALLSARWKETLAHKPDRYTDSRWWNLRKQIEEPWGVQMTLIHGPDIPNDIEQRIISPLENGIKALKTRISQEEKWFLNLQSCFKKPTYYKFHKSEPAMGCLFAWAGRIQTD